MPATLLERRPDVAAAERAVAAANARIGVARSAFFPSLTITAAGGYEALQLEDLFKWGSRSLVLGPLAGTALSLPIFDGGRRQASVDQAHARYAEEVASYRGTVLNAFREVEDNLASLRYLAEQVAVQDKAVSASSRAADLSRKQYREGTVSYLDVIESNRSLLAQQRAALQLKSEHLANTIGLIRSLGGSWDTPATPPKAVADVGRPPAQRATNGEQG
jgi:outer membrane protein, multidrug efflux system